MLFLGFCHGKDQKLGDQHYLEWTCTIADSDNPANRYRFKSFGPQSGLSEYSTLPMGTIHEANEQHCSTLSGFLADFRDQSSDRVRGFPSHIGHRWPFASNGRGMSFLTTPRTIHFLCQDDPGKTHLPVSRLARCMAPT